MSRAEYEAEIISLRPWGLNGRRAPGISDQARDAEYEAQHITYATLEHCVADLERAAAKSGLMRDRILELRDLILDNIPGRISWDERISDARRGY